MPVERERGTDDGVFPVMPELFAQPLELPGAENVFRFTRRCFARLAPRPAIQQHELNLTHLERAVNIRRLCCKAEGLEKLRFGSVATRGRDIPRIRRAAEKIVIVPYRRDLTSAGAHMHEQSAEM